MLVGQLVASDVPAQGLVRRGHITENSFTGSKLARLAVDDPCAVLDPAPPTSLIQGLTTPLGDALGAAANMLPDRWVSESEPVEVPSVWLLEGAHVFGGNITTRRAGWYNTGQLLLTADMAMIPASYGVMDGNRELAETVLEQHPDGLHLRDAPVARELAGTYYFLGNVHRHFGHNLVEGLTRLWALDMLSEGLTETARYLVYEDELAPYSLELLRLAGVPTDRITYAGPHDLVERLIVPDVSMRTHRWITRLQSDVWDSMADSAGPGEGGAKVFLSRSATPDRPLRNNDEVEAFFKGAGYDIVCPEKLTVEEQIRMARDSTSLAGCVGSQMYLAAFQQPGCTNIVLAPRNFYLKDDVLIAAATGANLEVVLGSKVDHRKPKAQRSWTVNVPSIEQALTRSGL